jgi:hypothetical protein
VAANIPAEYLTATEGDATYLKAIPDTYLTDAEGDARYAPAGNYLTAVPDEYLTATEGDAAYAAKAHTHTAANITDFASAVAANIPTTYATDAEVAAAYQPKGTYLTAVPLMGGNQIGGAMVGNGLAMSTNYLYVKAGAGLGIAADNSLQVQTTNTSPVAVKFWTGTQATYDALTGKDANTLYFITG